MQLDRHTTAEAAADVIRKMIIDGRLPDGERINETRLAKQLGVSRTPLREALARLASEGSVTAKANHGVYIAPLTLEDFNQLHQIRPILDPEALRLGGIPSTDQIERLAKLNDKLRKEKNPSKAVEIDDRWHRELLSACPNRVLLEMIDMIILRTRRYELALFRETKARLAASDEHTQIVDALRNNDLESACAALRRNMTSGYAPLAEWLEGRNARQEQHACI